LQLSRGSVPIAPELAAAIASAVPSDFSSPSSFGRDLR